MAGINRLGKAPPKPGTLRPPDPNKYRTVDMFSEGTEGDADYMRMVQDIEDMQQQQGWLFGRGAFDKGDLLYLRDEAEKQRHAELELRDSEKTQFAALRASFEKQEGQGDVIRIARKDRTGGRSQPELIAHLVRVKTHALHPADHDPGGVQEAKRAKSSDGKPFKRLRASPPSPSAVPVVENSEVEQEAACSGEEEGGLAGLLGNYDSSSDGEEKEQEEPTGDVKYRDSKPSTALPQSTGEGSSKIFAKCKVTTQGSPVDPGDCKDSKWSLDGGNSKRPRK